MDLYEKLNDTVYCKNLLQFGDKLTDFPESVLKEKNRAKYVDLFYQRMMEYHLTDYIWDDFPEKTPERYHVVEGGSASGKYLAFAVPPQGKPVETLRRLNEFGQSIREDFSEHGGKQISRKHVDEILSYLEQKFEFSGKVFCDKKALICIIPYSHKEFNSECLIRITEGIEQHIFLYKTIDRDGSGVTPEFVFFHELGHALAVRYAKGFEVPAEIAAVLNRCFPKLLTQASPDEIQDVIADILSIGMLFNSPYEKYDPFTAIREKDKELFHQFVKQMLDSLPNKN